MKKKFGLFVLPLVTVMSLAGCKKKVEPEGPTGPQISIYGASEWGVNGKTTYTSSVEGVTWTSSNTGVATISESGEFVGLSAGQTTLTATKEGYESASLTVTVIANPYSFSKEQLGWYSGVFKGADGTLDVQSTVAGLDNGESVKALFPTRIGEEDFYYRDPSSVSPKNIKETYQVLYFESKFNDADYRLRMTQSEFKLVQLDKLVNGQYQKVAEYHPTDFARFTGAYNAWGDYSEYNQVYIYTAEEVDAGEGHVGFKINAYSEYYSQLQETTFINELGYQTVISDEGEISYVYGFQQFDLSDGEYFEGVLSLTPESTGLAYVGDTSDYWFADPTPFFTDIIDEEGEELSNSYDVDWDTFDYIFQIGSDAYSIAASRDEHGLKFTMTAEEKPTYEVRIGEVWSYKVGEETKKFGLYDTLFEPYYWETVFENADNSSTFEYWLDLDWDTWEETTICNFDGEPVDPSTIKAVATGDGFVAVTFTSGEKEVSVTKLTSALVKVKVDSESEIYVLRDYIDTIFDVTLTNGVADFEIDTAAHTISFADLETPINFYYSELYNTVVANFAGTELIRMDKDTGFYMAVNSVAEQAFPLLTKDSYESLYGTYTTDGSLHITLSAEGLSVNGQAAQFSLALLQLSSGFAIGFAFGSYAFVPSFNKTATLYANVSGQIVRMGTLVEESFAQSFMGKYHAYSEYGLETIEFTDDYKFVLDFWDKTKEELVPTEFPYAFSVSEDGLASIIAYTSETSGVIFNHLDYALKAGDLLYVHEALYFGRGIYKSSDNTKTVSIWQNRITLTDTSASEFGRPFTTYSESIVSIDETSENVFTITADSERVYVLTLNSSNEVVSLTVDEAEFTKVGDELFNHVLSGSEVKLTIDEVEHTLKFIKEYNSYSNTMNCRISYDGGQGDSGFDGLRAYVDSDGNVCAFFTAAGTLAKIYVDSEHHLVAEKVEQSTPTPPVPPAP